MSTTLFATERRVDGYLGNGDGTFQRSATLLPNLGGDYGALDVGDFDCDGVSDVAFVSFSRGQTAPTLNWALGVGDGTFSSLQQQTTMQPITSVIAVDLNGDGASDLVTTGHAQPAQQAWLSRGAGSFATPFTLPGTQPVVVFAHLDHSGGPDLIESNGTDGVEVFPNQCR